MTNDIAKTVADARLEFEAACEMHRVATMALEEFKAENGRKRPVKGSELRASRDYHEARVAEADRQASDAVQALRAAERDELGAIEASIKGASRGDLDAAYAKLSDMRIAASVHEAAENKNWHAACDIGGAFQDIAQRRWLASILRKKDVEAMRDLVFKRRGEAMFRDPTPPDTTATRAAASRARMQAIGIGGADPLTTEGVLAAMAWLSTTGEGAPHPFMEKIALGTAIARARMAIGPHLPDMGTLDPHLQQFHPQWAIVREMDGAYVARSGTWMEMHYARNEDHEDDAAYETASAHHAATAARVEELERALGRRA